VFSFSWIWIDVAQIWMYCIVVNVLDFSRTLGCSLDYPELNFPIQSKHSFRPSFQARSIQASKQAKQSKHFRLVLSWCLDLLVLDVLIASSSSNNSFRADLVIIWLGFCIFEHSRSSSKAIIWFSASIGNWQFLAISINLCLITVNSFFWIDPLVLV